MSRLSATAVRAYPRHQPPVTAFINGTPERRTASAEEYFQVGVPHANPADGRVAQWYRIDRGGWRPMPGSRVFYTGQLGVGPHQASVRTANRAGTTEVSFRWQVVPLPAPLACLARPGHPCWYPPHLARDHHPMRWDWQIGRVTPLQRTGKHAVDIYDVDGFLTTRAEVAAIRTRWQASTLAHPKAVCYLDLAWEDYRPDASPSPRGGYFPAATLGNVYYGYPEERWLDFRQLDALKPMLAERIGMCARKGFDAVELDDIDSFDPPSTTGFRLTPGDAENFLAWAFNEIHRDGMTGLWKNSPWLSWWGRQYADGAVVEECYVGHVCFAAQLRGSRQYGITCTGLHGGTPCGWDDFSTDVTPQQPGGKWVGEAEYSADHYVCNPGQRCSGPHAFAAFCRAVWAPPGGFAAVKFDVNLDGRHVLPLPPRQLKHAWHSRHTMHRRAMRHYPDRDNVPSFIGPSRNGGEAHQTPYRRSSGPIRGLRRGPGRPPADGLGGASIWRTRSIAVTVTDAITDRTHRSAEMITGGDISSVSE